MDEAIDNIRVPIAAIGIMHMVDNWVKMRKDRHGFAATTGKESVMRGFVVETKCQTLEQLNGIESI